MQVMYPTYTLRVEIKDTPPAQLNSGGVGMVGYTPGMVGQGVTGGNPSGHKWFNSGAGKIGCDEVLKEVREALQKAGLSAVITFDKFEHR